METRGAVLCAWTAPRSRRIVNRRRQALDYHAGIATQEVHLTKAGTEVPERPDGGGSFVAFLFDADHESFNFNYGTPCEEAFLRSLAAADDARGCRSQIRRGDVLAHELASKLKRLVAVPEAQRKRKSAASLSREYGTDLRALATVIGDVADSLKDQWSSVDLVELPHHLGSTNVYCLSASSMSLHVVKRMDARLKRFAPYLGAVELDAGNPVHVHLFSRLLSCVYFDRGTLYVSRWSTDEGVHEFGRKPEKYFNVLELPYWEFERSAPPYPSSDAHSKRGAISAHRLNEVTKPSHFETVADGLFALAKNDHAAIDFQLVLPDDEQLEIPVAKLLGYSLSPEHHYGKHKARLFADLLGIDASHWRYLSYQLVEGLAQSKLERVRVTDHGVQYGAYVQVKGLNDKTYTVETGWIIRPAGGPAQLVTAYPADKRKQLVGEATCVPPWIPPGVVGPARWQAIYCAAKESAERAAATCVPTPMQIVGYGAELEGRCGGAWVALDGRSSFSRWLVAQGHAYKAAGGGVHVPASVNSQSVDRAIAYANAFRRVLWLNGINAAAEQYLS